jgi:hypothetical protein
MVNPLGHLVNYIVCSEIQEVCVELIRSSNITLPMIMMYLPSFVDSAISNRITLCVCDMFRYLIQ